MRNTLARWGRHRGFMVVMLMLTYSAQSLLITISKEDDGFSYNASSAVLLAEFAKLLFALSMWRPESRHNFKFRWGVCAYMIPAVLYVIQNRLVFEALTFISPPEYQLLNNMKLFTTSIVYRAVMRRPLRLLQWLALALLALGMFIATRPESGPSTTPDMLNKRGHNTWMGVVIMVVISWCSALAGVMNEYLIKASTDGDEASVWLYLFGTLAATVQLGRNGWSHLLALEGFTTATWMVVVCNALLGQSIAFLLRYADSIVKLYAVCGAMGFTAVVSFLVLGTVLGSQILCGYIVCGISVCLYYMPPQALLATDREFIDSMCKGSGSSTGSCRGDPTNIGSCDGKSAGDNETAGGHRNGSCNGNPTCEPHKKPKKEQ